MKTSRIADTTFFSGSITSFSIQGNAPDAEPVNPVLPALFSGKISNHNMITRVVGSALNQEQLECQNIIQIPLRTVQRAVLTLPLEITSSQTWTDSTSSITCSGGLPTATSVIRTFTVIKEFQWENIPALILNENERTFSKGEGSQGQHQIAIEARGSGNTQFYIDRSSGQLLAAKTQNNTSVSIESSGRVQHFTQNSTEITQIAR